VLAKGPIGQSELDEALDACRRQIADPDTFFTSYLVAQAWGRKPAGSGGPSSRQPTNGA
jgi:hypothetical protein